MPFTRSAHLALAVHPREPELEEFPDPDLVHGGFEPAHDAILRGEISLNKGTFPVRLAFSFR